jgi:hypothetical protein
MSLTPHIDQYCFNTSLTLVDVSKECLRCAEAKKKIIFLAHLFKLCDMCYTGFMQVCLSKEKNNLFGTRRNA